MNDLLFEFNRGFWPGDGLKTSIHAICNDADHVLIKVQPYNFFHFILHMKAQEFIMPVSEMEKITAIIKTIINWKTEYEADLDILDGYGWDIEYHFSGIDFKSGGYESFPSNYRIKVTELQTIIEELCQKYNPDGYDPRYRQKRIKL